MGYLLLAGGAEFGKRMAEPDQKAIELAGGPNAPICIIPTAAAPDHNHVRAGNNGVNWFRSLGAKDVVSLPLVDKASAASDSIVHSLRNAKLIYLLGGFPEYLGKTLQNSPAWEAVLAAYQAGAVIAGSSAGAMVLCQYYYSPDTGQVLQGLGLVRNVLVLPHHETFGKGWAPRLLPTLPGVTLLGIDERTGLLDDGYGENWLVLGQGTATLYQGSETKVYRTGESFHI
jgi:cyanophycinase